MWKASANVWVDSFSCFGDFSELLQVKDKRGGVPRAHNLMQMLRHVLDHCGFVDLGYLGLDFTWHGR